MNGPRGIRKLRQLVGCLCSACLFQRTAWQGKNHVRVLPSTTPFRALRIRAWLDLSFRYDRAGRQIEAWGVDGSGLTGSWAHPSNCAHTAVSSDADDLPCSVPGHDARNDRPKHTHHQAQPLAPTIIDGHTAFTHARFGRRSCALYLDFLALLLVLVHAVRRLGVLLLPPPLAAAVLIFSFVLLVLFFHQGLLDLDPIVLDVREDRLEDI
jgi:hypothetical protein